MSKDYYKILGVSKSSSSEEIKKAFRKKAHEFHPDKSSGNAEKFKEINEAYQILGNEEKRKKYDQFGDSAFSGQGFGGTGMGWDDFVRKAGGAKYSGQGGFGFNSGGINFDFGDIGDIFGDIFGFGGSSHGGSRNRGPRKGESLEIQITIDFEEAVFGVEKNIEISRVAECEHCKGTGAKSGSKIVKCSDCGGSGKIIKTQSTFFGTFQSSSVCEKCFGSGEIAEKPCDKCQGAGRAEKREHIKIKIPAGIDDSQTIKMSGLGNAGDKSGGYGDLFVKIRVRKSKKFERDGYDVYSVSEISIPQAVLGDTVKIETVHGEVNLKIPQGTQSGTKFKLSGKGISKINSSSKGDHYVEILVKIPKKISRKEKKLFEDLMNEEKKNSWF